MKFPELSAIVLAGGFSRRMNGFKPLLRLGEDTFTGRTIALFQDFDIPVILVGGYRSEELFSAVLPRNVITRINPEYARGMFSSICTGIACIEPECRGFFLLPVDIPLIRPATITRLIEAFEMKPDSIIYPVFNQRRGHPTLIPTHLIPHILSWQGSGGLKAFLQQYENQAVEIPVADRFIIKDVDTPEDYQQLLQEYETYDIPDDEECRIISEDICRVKPAIIAHGKMVARIATVISQSLEEAGLIINSSLVQAAARLHDIAKGQPKHDAAGGRILTSLGFARVGNVVGVHTELSGGPVNLEAKIVYLADKLVRGEQVVSLDKRYSISAEQYGKDPDIGVKVAERKQRAEETASEIEALAGISLSEMLTGTVAI